MKGCSNLAVADKKVMDEIIFLRSLIPLFGWTLKMGAEKRGTSHLLLNELPAT